MTAGRGEIWLADLVTRIRVDGHAGDWGMAAVQDAVRQNAFSAGTLVRASW